jgi:hypothetical protein
MAEWVSTYIRLDTCDYQDHRLRAGSFEIIVAYYGELWQVSAGGDSFDLQATDAEAAKAEAVAMFRAKLEAALEEIEGL